jgi:UbiD family decarboxylase
LGRRARQPNLDQLPVLTTWPRDGGPFLTLPLVYTEHLDTQQHNLGIYRMQRYDAESCGMHWQIGKGGGFHHHLAESRGQVLPVNVFLGGPPAAILAAVAPLPENVPELLLASLLSGEKISLCNNPDGPLPLLADCEIALVGEVRPGQRRLEGPFGDHYGYYSLEHEFPVFHCKALFERKNAIYPATVVGKPRQEDFYIGDYLQELLQPLFPLVMPSVEDLWSYGETGYHSLAAAVVKQRYRREAMTSAFRILGEGQLSLTKFLLVLDRPRDLRNFAGTLQYVLERFDPRCDLYVFGNLAMDTLDYNGPRINEGSKGVLLGLGKARRELPHSFRGELPRGFSQARVFCPGCLVLSGPSHVEEKSVAQRVARHPAISSWPMVVLVDDAERACASEANFLWTTFTRFEPAADIHAGEVELQRLHPTFSLPLILDARLKGGFPDELFCAEETAELVEKRWKEYFPSTDVEMGDSDRGHLV